MSLNMAEVSLTKPAQKTMFWQVLQENGGNVASLGKLVHSGPLSPYADTGKLKVGPSLVTI